MKKLFIVLAAMLTFTSTAFAQIGSTTTDLVFTPVTPCRIFDTRPSQGGTGPIAAAGTKSFIVWGGGFTSQGGVATNCGITAGGNTTGVAVNLTVVTPSTAGFITAYPFGTTKPVAATVNFNAGDVRGNFAIVQIPAGSNASDMSIFSSSATDVVGDIVGYYSKPVATALECVNTAYASIVMNNGPISGLYYAVATAPACPATYASTALHCTADNVKASANPWISSDVQCVGNSPTNTESLYARQRCCRIPGR